MQPIVLAGCLFCLDALICTHPYFVLCSRTEIGKMMSAMVRREGPKSLWKGLIPTLWRDVPFSAIYWWLYESSKVAVRDHVQGPYAAFICGAASGTVC